MKKYLTNDLIFIHNKTCYHWQYLTLLSIPTDFHHVINKHVQKTQLVKENTRKTKISIQKFTMASKRLVRQTDLVSAADLKKSTIITTQQAL